MWGKKEKFAKSVYWYQLEPVNLFFLPLKEQDVVMESYETFLNSLEYPVEFYVYHEPVEMEYLGHKFNYESYDFYLKSYENVAPLLERAGIRYHPLISEPSFGEYYTHKKFLIINGKYYSNIVVVKPAPYLDQGFLINFIPNITRLAMKIEPIDTHSAYNMLKMKEKILAGRIVEAQNTGAPVDAGLLAEYNTVSSYLEQLQAREIRLFYTTIVFTVSGETQREAITKAKFVKRELESRGFVVDYPSFVQHILYELTKPRFITDTLTLTTFYPLITTSLTDPGGLYLGNSLYDNSPILLNLWIHTSFNIFALGPLGVGKSMFAKVFLLRNLMQYPDLEYYIIDPENEFIPLLVRTGGQTILVREDRELGLDPLHLFPKYEAINIIALLIGLPQELKGELASLTMTVSNIRELYQQASEKLKQYLVRLVKGPESFVFLGEPQNISSRVGFCIRDITSTEVKRIIAIMALAKIWQTIKESSEKGQKRKIVIIDEAWMFLNDPTIANFLAEISAGARKRFTSLILLTQQPLQVLQVPIGKVLLQNSAIKLLLKQDINTIPELAQLFSLESWEQELLYKLETGQAYLLAEHIRLPIQIIVTKDEYNLFTTKPTDFIKRT
ncbi:MAG: VirB4 family type IV secretion system protein [Thermoprotei archaeon]|jgi:hypothetical protein